MLALLGWGFFAGAFLLFIFAPLALLFTPPILIVFVVWRWKHSLRAAVLTALLVSVPYWQHLPVRVLLDHMVQAPMREMTERVEFPESVFVRFDCPDNERMWNGTTLNAENLLDGTHLRTLAVAPARWGSTRYEYHQAALFRLEEAPPAEAERQATEPGPDQQDGSAGKIALTAFSTPEQVPPMRYTARFTFRVTRLLWLWPLYRTEEVRIHDNKNGRRIAWARKYRRFSLYDFVAGSQNGFGDTRRIRSFQGPDVELECFMREVLFGYAGQEKKCRQ